MTGTRFGSSTPTRPATTWVNRERGCLVELRAYLSILLKWWWLFLLCTVLGAATSFAVSQSTIPIYQSTTTLMVGQSLQMADPSTSDFATSEKLALTYSEIARRQPVLQATVETLNLPFGWQQLRDNVGVRIVQGTQLIEISIKDTVPERAQATADELARQLIRQSPTSPENATSAQYKEFVQRQLGDLQSKIDEAGARLVELEQDLTTAFSGEEAQKIQDQMTTLQSQIDTWQSNYAQLLGFLGQASPNYLSVVEPAQFPKGPIQPRTSQNVLLAAVVGLVIAGGVAILLEYLDDTIKTPDDVTGMLGLVALGGITRLQGTSYPEKLIIVQPEHSPVGEAYRMLRSNVQFMADGKPLQTLLVTSPGPLEGKSITLANMGVVFAQNGLRTILVDSDLRRPVLHRIFQVPNQMGLSNLLLAPVTRLTDEIIQSTEVDNLRVITSGPLPPNPSELLGSARLSQLIAELHGVADVVIFDSPPVLSATDAALLANRLDGTVLVTDSGRTRREAALHSIDQLQRAGANLLGGVLNRLQKKAGAYYYYERYYSAAEENHKGDRSDNQGRSFSRPAWWKKLGLSEKKD
jgi:succinoglycan biosynthesis transport protein ExoP